MSQAEDTIDAARADSPAGGAENDHVGRVAVEARSTPSNVGIRGFARALPVRLRRWARRRPYRAGVAAVVIVVVVAAGISYVGKLREPGSDTVAERTAEWLRDVHLGTLVNFGELVLYKLHPPAEGGTPRPIPGAGPLAPQIDAPAIQGADPGVAHLRAPEPLVSPASPAVPNEGAWRPVASTPGGSVGIYTTEIRPDAVHTSYVVTVDWLDPKVVRFRLHPGLEVPGGKWSTPPEVPSSDRPNLLGAFNGGFRMQDAHGGFYADGKGGSSLVAGDATLAIDTDGVMSIGEWGRDMSLGLTVAAARQNLALIVDNGQPAPDLDENPHDKWGATVGNKVFVWRSGVGVTAGGAVVYVGGPSMSAKSLAETLARAGAVRAMELDINHDWVSFNTYRTTDGVTTGTKALDEMFRNGDRYLTNDSRDFIAAYQRAPADSPSPSNSAPATTANTTPRTRPSHSVTTHKTSRPKR